MTSTGTFQGLKDDTRNSSKVLKPPGGGSSDIFGSGPEESCPRRVKNYNQSQLGSALFGQDSSSASNTNGSESARSNKPDGNPVTGTGYADQTANRASNVQNGTSSSSGDKSSDSSSPPSSGKTPTRNRVPPGGYSSGLW